MRKARGYRLLLGILILGLSGLIYLIKDSNRPADDSLENLLLQSRSSFHKNRIKLGRIPLQNQVQKLAERLPASTTYRKFEHKRYGSLVESGALAIPTSLAQLHSLTILGEENGYAFVSADALSPDLRRTNSTAVVMYSRTHFKPVLISSYVRIVLKDARHQRALQNFLQTVPVQPLHKELNTYSLSFADIPNDQDINELVESIQALKFVEMADIPEVLPRVDSP